MTTENISAHQYRLATIAATFFMDLDFINTNDILSCINDVNLNNLTKDEFEFNYPTSEIELVNLIYFLIVI